MNSKKRSVLALLTTSLVASGVLLGAMPAQAAGTSHRAATPAAGSPLDPILAAIQAEVVAAETQVQNLLTNVECLINFNAPPTCGAPL